VGLTRRQILMGTTALAALPLFGAARPALAAPSLGDTTPFSMTWLVDRAKTVSQAPFVPPDESLPAEITQLTYDQQRAIRFLPEQALWRPEKLPFQMQFFHLGALFDKPVHIFQVDGYQAKEILYRQDLFDLGGNKFPDNPSDHLGFAGFRLHYAINRPEFLDEIAVFLAASYFRCLGRKNIYGLSARGLAIDTGSTRGEEFPVFRQFWVETPAPDATQIRVYALLDSPGVSGAYSFLIKPGETTTVDIEATLYPRHTIDKFGIAPLTSMFLFGPQDHRSFDDFRPEVHDSDGLSMWSGAGEWLWRPLRNPARLLISSFMDENPRGFGLMQRQRSYSSYQDLEALYERRPSLWVEPLSGWGPGVVQLVEIPTDREIHDNIVAFWVPKTPVDGGQEWKLSYRLHWGMNPPVTGDRGIVVSTRTGAGGVSGSDSKTSDTRKFVIDFKGGALDSLPEDASLEAVVTASAGEIQFPVAQRNPELGGWRAFFDLKPAGDDPAELRCYLRQGGNALTETWSFQWTP